MLFVIFAQAFAAGIRFRALVLSIGMRLFSLVRWQSQKLLRLVGGLEPIWLKGTDTRENGSWEVPELSDTGDATSVLSAFH